MSNHDSTAKTLLVAVALCVFCSIFVSYAAVALKPEQVANKQADKNRSILAAAGMLEPGKKVDELFQRVEVKIVNLETGEYLTEENAQTDWERNILADPAGYDQRSAAKTSGQNQMLTGEQDIASIKRKPKYATVYLAKDEQGVVESIILPISGYGLWSTLHGFLALETDLNTVVGLGFYEHAETPGLGGEVDNPAWKALWPGKKVFDENGEVAIALVKGNVDTTNNPQAIYQVDGLAGSTLTSRGVTNLVQFWVGEDGFGPYLKKLKEQGV